jgi:hypothetical protein
MEQFNLSEKEVIQKVFVTENRHTNYRVGFIYTEDVKEFIKILKEGDLYKEFIDEYGEVALSCWDICSVFNLIEDYIKKKIDKLSGDKLKCQ